MYCKKCGTEIDDDSIFCYMCGIKVVSEENDNEEIDETSKQDDIEEDDINDYIDTKENKIIPFNPEEEKAPLWPILIISLIVIGAFALVTIILLNR